MGFKHFLPFHVSQILHTMEDDLSIRKTCFEIINKKNSMG